MLTRVPVDRAAASVERACREAGNGDELLEAVADEVGKAVPFDGSLWLGVDPATLLATSPGRASGIEGGQCSAFWDREFHVQDAILYRDLARQPVPVATLRDATDDQPVRSARYREFLSPQGYDDELRAVFRTGDNSWGLLGLYRQKGRPSFDAHDVAVVDAVCELIATALRAYVVAATPWLTASSTPGMLLFDGDDRLLSSNPEALQWLEEVQPFAGAAGDWIRRLDDPGPFDIAVPTPLIALIARAKAVADGHERGPARLRLRGRNGRWLVLHASCLDGGPWTKTVAVMIEPAKSAEIAPIIIEAYALTPRERDVVRAVARGLSTAEMAAELFLSTHTVRDYVKSVFDKVGVSSRGELVAKLFAEHYSDAMHASFTHAD
ncbi:MAG: LuxR C-terminal-related transcriptional regulator [Actinomycetota bacterium]|nr:LuxR C-terminal-related transcriptional regulator [Actinomycetota bacterium]